MYRAGQVDMSQSRKAVSPCTHAALLQKLYRKVREDLKRSTSQQIVSFLLRI